MRSFQQLIYFSVLFLFISKLTSAANWYVDRNATGQNNGISWANAWQSFSAIKWNQIQPGDVLYISGGTDSVIYQEQLNIQTHGSVNNYVTVRNGIDTGHNGRVIIDGGFTRNYGVLIEEYGTPNHDWVYVKGFEVRRTKLHGIYLHGYINHIVVDSCKITETLGRSIHIIGGDDYNLAPGGPCAEDIEIKNCVAISHPDESTTEDDVLYFQMAAGVNIHHNYFHQRNRQSQTQYPNHMHIDAIQSHVVRDVKIWNNVCIVDSGILGHTMILGVQSRPGNLDTLIIYNNYIKGGGHLLPGGNPYGPNLYLRWYGYGSSVMPPAFVYQNTIVATNGGSFSIYHEYPAWVKNNIIAQYGTNGQNPSNYGGQGLATWSSGWNTSWTVKAEQSTNNLMWRDYGNAAFGNNRWEGVGGSPIGSVSGWNDWVNRYGGTGLSSNPQFVNNIRGRYGYVISETSPARNKGENLKAFIESKGLPWTDIEGKPRGSSPTLGAYEFQSPNNIEGENTSHPTDFILYQNYPNPFNPSTTIGFSLPTSTQIRINVYNMLGELVVKLTEGFYEVGYHQLEFNADNLTSGIYLYRIESDTFVEVKKMILLR
ncbi:MAG: T9SS type A sorting domain-containing protein [Candidatus Eremiobacterota bacterium]